MSMKIVSNGRLRGTKYYLFYFVDDDEFRSVLSMLRKTAETVLSDDETKRMAALRLTREMDARVSVKKDDEEYGLFSALFEDEMCAFAEAVYYMLSNLQDRVHANNTGQVIDNSDAAGEKEKRTYPSNNMISIMNEYYKEELGMNLETKEETREKRIAENKANNRPENSGVEWTEEEDEQLEREFEAGMKTWKIGQIHKRSAYAIWRRLKIHGLV